jgi:hypothetical protein
LSVRICLTLVRADFLTLVRADFLTLSVRIF